MTTKKKKPQPVAAQPNAEAPKSDAPRLRLVTIARPRRVVVEDWSGEVPDNGVVEHDGERCFVDHVA